MGPALDHLRLVASAIAGCPLEVAAADVGEPPWTDGSTVFLPREATGAEHVRMIGLQASLIAVGSLDPVVVRPLARRPVLLRRYLAVEGHRALAANEHALPPLVHRLIDVRIASGLDDLAASVELARSRQELDEPPPEFGTIRARRLLAAAERRHASPETVPGRAAQAGAIGSELAELPDDADGGDEDGLGDLLSSPVGGGGPVGGLLRRMLRPVRHRDRGGPPGADAPTHRSGRPRGGAQAASASSAPASRLDPTIVTARTGRTYPEWDLHRCRYRPDWCTVTEIAAPTAAQGAPIPEDLALRRSLARLGMGLTPCRRERQGDDIDIDAVVEALVDARAGTPHDDDVYVDSLRRRRDLAVLVLLDVSGSAGEPGTGGKTVHEHQRAVAGALTAALHDLGDRVALYGFSSRWRRMVQLVGIKSFDDRLDGEAARRLAAVAPGAYTRLGAAIRHGTSILDEHGGTPRRLLVVLSDGLAYDHGYEGRYGEADARRALVEARRLGVGCLCLSVGTDADPAALRRVFGAAAHASVPRPEQLPGLVGPLFRAALRSAEAQRRAFQRRERTRERLDIEGGGIDGRTSSALLPARR